jgi:hypothetical protein
MEQTQFPFPLLSFYDSCFFFFFIKNVVFRRYIALNYLTR